MARFAKNIMEKMIDLCAQLEVILGPDTGDLMLRIGLHSGAVTAGVLRGEKSVRAAQIAARLSSRVFSVLLILIFSFIINNL